MHAACAGSTFLNPLLEVHFTEIVVNPVGSTCNISITFMALTGNMGSFSLEENYQTTTSGETFAALLREKVKCNQS